MPGECRHDIHRFVWLRRYPHIEVARGALRGGLGELVGSIECDVVDETRRHLEHLRGRGVAGAAAGGGLVGPRQQHLAFRPESAVNLKGIGYGAALNAVCARTDSLSREEELPTGREHVLQAVVERGRGVAAGILAAHALVAGRERQAAGLRPVREPVGLNVLPRRDSVVLAPAECPPGAHVRAGELHISQAAGGAETRGRPVAETASAVAALRGHSGE